MKPSASTQEGKGAGLVLRELKVGGWHSEIPGNTSSLISLYLYKDLIIIQLYYITYIDLYGISLCWILLLITNISSYNI